MFDPIGAVFLGLPRSLLIVFYALKGVFDEGSY